MKSQLRKHPWCSMMAFAFSLGLLLLPTGCGNSSTPATPSASSPSAPSSVTVAINPSTVTVPEGGSLSFVATVKGAANTSVTWSVQEGTTGGSITSLGVYTAPNTLGTYHVVATSVADATASASAAVTSSGPPFPTITAFSPTSIVAGSATGFVLLVTGTNFVATSVINFGATALTTTLVASNQLTAAIPTAAVTSAGTVAVTVTNPGPGGGTSNTVQFTIGNGTNPVPTIYDLNPRCAPVGEQGFVLAVEGPTLVPNSVVRWNGTDLPTRFDSNLLYANIPASYIATAGTASITVFNPAPGGGISNPVSFNIETGGVGPVSMAVDPTGKFAYVANQGCPGDFYSNVSMYTIDPTDGTLTSAGPRVTTGDYSADSVAVDPSGKFAYVANSGDYFDPEGGSVSMYAINGTTGTLTPNGAISGCSSEGCTPVSLAVHPSGKFVYVAHLAGYLQTSVSTYAINPTTGVLQIIGDVAVPWNGFSVTVDPSGKFAYVGISPYDPNGASLLIYSIDATTGVLTSIGTLPGVGPAPLLAIHPSGKFVYLVDSVLDQISTYTLNPKTGNLASIGTLSAIPGPIVVHPSGKFAYVTSSAGGVAMYTIDATTGALTSAGTTASGTTPDSITFHPSGKFAYGTNYSSNTVSMYSVDTSSGSLTLIGTIGT
jgi:6-phosphogluconolactonase (cycloisomerase 2 family)